MNSFFVACPDPANLYTSTGWQDLEKYSLQFLLLLLFVLILERGSCYIVLGGHEHRDWPASASWVQEIKQGAQVVDG